MGYYNPIYVYGVDRFLRDAKSAGVDGLIVVDLPPEEDEELCLPALEPAHALARVMDLAPQKPKDHLMVVNLSGRGDKDLASVAAYLERRKG